MSLSGNVRNLTSVSIDVPSCCQLSFGIAIDATPTEHVSGYPRMYHWAQGGQLWTPPFTGVSCRMTALPSTCRYLELRRWVAERSWSAWRQRYPITGRILPPAINTGMTPYPNGCEVVIGETRADDTAPAGDDSSDVVRECPLDGVMAECIGMADTSRESPP